MKFMHPLLKKRINIQIDPTQLDEESNFFLTNFLRESTEESIVKGMHESRNNSFFLKYSLLKIANPPPPYIKCFEIHGKVLNNRITKISGILAFGPTRNSKTLQPETIEINPCSLNPETKKILWDFIVSHPDVHIRPGIYKFQPMAETENTFIYLRLTHHLLKSRSVAHPSLWRIEVLGEKLQSGASGIVVTTLGVIKPEKDMLFHVKKPHKKHVAKIIPKTATYSEKKIRKEAEKTKIANPALHCHSSFFNDNNGYIIMRQVLGMDLYEFNEAIQSGEINISLLDLLKITLSALKALQDIHNRGRLHLDIKPENMIINHETCSVTLIDFAFSAPIEKTFSKKIKGSLLFISPESLLIQVISPATDMFALGWSLSELWGNMSLDEFGMEGKNAWEVRDFHSKESFSQLFSFINIPEEIASDIEQLLHGLIRFHPDKRLKSRAAIAQMERIIEMASSGAYDKNLIEGNCVSLNANSDDNNPCEKERQFSL